jgi:hypothetical protein
MGVLTELLYIDVSQNEISSLPVEVIATPSCVTILFFGQTFLVLKRRACAQYKAATPSHAVTGV